MADSALGGVTQRSKSLTVRFRVKVSAFVLVWGPGIAVLWSCQRQVRGYVCVTVFAFFLLIWLELRRLPPIMGFVGSGPGLVIILA